MDGSNKGRGAVRGIAILVVGFLAAGAFVVGPASAGKFLTKKKALKLFYTKSDADSRFINVGEKASDADKLDGIDSTGFESPVIRSGETVRGTIGARFPNPGAGIEVGETASLPREAPVGLDDAHVVVNGVDETGNVCPGTSANPTAAPGYACMYPWYTENATLGGGYIWGSFTTEGKWGFQISWRATAAAPTVVFATWAYTAP